MPDIADIEIIAPHFKHRLSGVTTTMIQLVPRQVEAGVRIATLGPGLPDGMPKIRFRDLLKCWRPPKSGRLRIWHARRNIEMLFGILLRDVLRMPFRLIFTSASQRHHTRYSKWLIRRMDHVVATSARTGHYLEVPYTVVMHGIDTKRFQPLPTAAAPGGRLLAGCAGRVRHQKGTDLFVDAMITLLPRFPQWDALVAGHVTPTNQGYADELKRKVDTAGLAERIRFLGEISSGIESWYPPLSVYVAPSRKEGFGITPLEAMACGVPTVAGNVGAYDELIVSGETGMVVPTDDLAAFTAALQTYLADPPLAARHGQNAVAHVRTNFDIGNEVEGLNRVYAAVWSGR